MIANENHTQTKTCFLLRLGNYTSGSVGKPRISSLGDMTGARNDHKTRILTGLPASCTGATILANEAILVTA